MTARLPAIGESPWAPDLRDFLNAGHNADGTHDPAIVAETASVATVADLLALDISAFANGRRINVIAYDANGRGGGVFRWDSASTAATDGGVTFIPNSLKAAAIPYSLEYGHFSTAAGFRQLPQTNIVWGSVAISIQDGAQTIGSKWLHGHSIDPRHSPLEATRDTPLLDHATGIVWGDAGLHIRRLIQTNTVGGTAAAADRTAVMNYSYATGAGRWIREVDDFVTPAMFGGKPGDAAFDNSFFTAWALNWLKDQGRVKKLKLDGNYYVKGFWAEIYSHILIEGQGMEIPAITFMGDQGGGAGGVVDFLKDAYINSPTVNNTTDPYYCLGLWFGGAIQHDNATGFAFRDLCIDGNVANNLYFLDNVGSAWDLGAEGRMSQVLREGPVMTGLSVTDQSGRYIAADTRWYMHRCTIKNLLGGCIVYANGGFMHYSDVRLGNSLSGRVLYGGQGMGRGLVIFGYTRSSYWAPYSGHFSDIILEQLTENPWAENALDPAMIVYRGEVYRGAADDAGYSAILQERWRLNHLTLNGFAIDVGLTSSEIFNLVGERWDISNGSILGPTTGSCRIMNGSNGGTTGAISGPNMKGVRYLNRSTDGPTLLKITGSGYCAKLNFSDITIQDQFTAGIGLSNPNTFATALTGSLLWFNMDPHPGGTVPTFPKQILELTDVYCETMMQWMIVAEGAGDAAAIPTEVHIRGGSMLGRQNKLVKSAETDTTFAAGKLKIFLTDFAFCLFDPGEANREEADTVDPWIAITVMRNCRTQNGRVSEIDELVTRTVVGSAPGASQVLDTTVNSNGYIDIPINLLWKPMTYSATPVSANAITRGVTSVSPVYPITTGAIPDNTLPRLRVGVGAVTAGDVLTYNLRAAVAPPRSLG